MTRRVYVPYVRIPDRVGWSSCRAAARRTSPTRPGPVPDSPDDRAAARGRLHRAADLVPGDRAALAPVPGRHARPALARSRDPVRRVLALRLRRRRRRADRRPRARRVDRGRLLDGLDHRPAGLAPAPREDRRASCSARPPTGSAPRSRSGVFHQGMEIAMFGTRWLSRSRIAVRGARTTAAKALDLEPDDVHEWAFAEFRSTSPWAVGQAVAALGRHHSRPWLSSIDVPTAVVVTRKDHVLPPRQPDRAGAPDPGRDDPRPQGRARGVRAPVGAVRAGVPRGRRPRSTPGGATSAAARGQPPIFFRAPPDRRRRLLSRPPPPSARPARPGSA